MQTPAQIEFEGVRVSTELRTRVDQHIAELERCFGRVAAAFALPEGREVHVGRTPKQDERYADFAFAIDHAFKRARLQLQDQARLMRGDVKHRAGSQPG